MKLEKPSCRAFKMQFIVCISASSACCAQFIWNGTLRPALLTME